MEKSSSQALERHQPGPPSWDDIGDAFETMGKVGLAMAIGMSAAGLFCRLAHQGKVKVPTLSGMVLNRNEPTLDGNRQRKKNG